MTTSVRSLAEQQKFGRIFFFIIILLSLLLRTTKIRQNFFVPSAHSIILDTSVSSLYGSTRLSYPYPHRLGFRFYSRQSIIYGSTRPRLSTFVPTHYASSSFFPFILPSRLVASTSCPRQYQSSFLTLLGVPCILCSWWV